jgi:hypothetical protein
MAEFSNAFLRDDGDQHRKLAAIHSWMPWFLWIGFALTPQPLPAQDGLEKERLLQFWKRHENRLNDSYCNSRFLLALTDATGSPRSNEYFYSGDLGPNGYVLRLLGNEWNLDGRQRTREELLQRMRRPSAWLAAFVVSDEICAMVSKRPFARITGERVDRFQPDTEIAPYGEAITGVLWCYPLRTSWSGLVADSDIEFTAFSETGRQLGAERTMTLEYSFYHDSTVKKGGAIFDAATGQCLHQRLNFEEELPHHQRPVPRELKITFRYDDEPPAPGQLPLPLEISVETSLISQGGKQRLQIVDLSQPEEFDERYLDLSGYGFDQAGVGQLTEVTEKPGRVAMTWLTTVLVFFAGAAGAAVALLVLVVVFIRIAAR